MKRIVFVIAILFSVDAYAATAKPPADNDGFFFKPYIGVDYEYTSASYNNIGASNVSYGDIFSNSFNGGDIHVGARVHQYLGFEASYFDTANSNKSNVLGSSIGTSSKYDGWSIDAMGYLPVDQAKKFELIATTGYANIAAKGSATISGTTYNSNENDNAWRIGGGAQYWVTDNLNIRGLVRYETLNGTAINDAVLADIGVNWQF